MANTRCEWVENQGFETRLWRKTQKNTRTHCVGNEDVFEKTILSTSGKRLKRGEESATRNYLWKTIIIYGKIEGIVGKCRLRIKFMKEIIQSN